MVAPVVLGRRPLIELLADPQLRAQVTDAFGTAIAASFMPGHPGHMRNITRDEARRRFAICEHWYKTLKADLHWSTDRVLAELPKILTTILAGGSYEPPTSTIYVPGR